MDVDIFIPDNDNNSCFHTDLKAESMSIWLSKRGLASAVAHY